MQLSRFNSPRQAWEPLHPSDWDDAAAAHLLRRASFSATPENVREAVRSGMRQTIRKLFAKPTPMPHVQVVEEIEEMRFDYVRSIREASDPEKRKLRSMQRQFLKSAFEDYAVAWMDFARQHQYSAQEKFQLFLQDVFVVARDKIRAVDLMMHHHSLLREHAQSDFPTLVKAVSRSPAMIQYLDLQQNSRQKPNENFARELLELFTLGEGNYSENDIKEAARAFTGYRFRNDGSGFHYAKWHHDPGIKTVFGRTGRWQGDDVIDIIFEQRASRHFIPREFLSFYVTHDAIPEPIVQELGHRWYMSDYSLPHLIETVFSSRYFYAPENRGNYIKSPIQFYIGLCQDLRLDVPPMPHDVLSPLRTMGQAFANPPNVRGWVYGKHWINNITLSARRFLVASRFVPLNPQKMNADDRKRLEVANAAGKGRIRVTQERLKPLLEKPPEAVAEHFCKYFLASPTNPKFQELLAQQIASGKGSPQRRIKDAAIALLQSPVYNFC